MKPLAHFVWYGAKFPFMNRVAIASALERLPTFRVILWHADPLDGQPDFDALRAHPRFEARPLSAEVLFPDGQNLPFDVARLRQMYASVRSFSVRSDLARAAICFHEGGIYFDTDVLVLRDLDPLLGHGCVLGREHVIWPHELVNGLTAYRLVGGPLLGRLRAILARTPRGEQTFERISGMFKLAANGAIMGGEPRDPFFTHLLKLTAAVPEHEWERPYRLGPHAVQQTLAEYGADKVTLLPPAAFFPLGPEISRQYFRVRRDAREAAARIASKDTYVVHWYSSVTPLNKYSAADILRDDGRTIFATLCAPIVRTMHDDVARASA